MNIKLLASLLYHFYNGYNILANQIAQMEVDKLFLSARSAIVSNCCVATSMLKEQRDIATVDAVLSDSLDARSDAEHVRGADRNRDLCGYANIPGGTPTLADMFPPNVSASEYVPWKVFASAKTPDVTEGFRDFEISPDFRWDFKISRKILRFT